MSKNGRDDKGLVGFQPSNKLILGGMRRDQDNRNFVESEISDKERDQLFVAMKASKAEADSPSERKRVFWVKTGLRREENDLYLRYIGNSVHRNEEGGLELQDLSKIHEDKKKYRSVHDVPKTYESISDVPVGSEDKLQALPIADLVDSFGD